MARARFTIWLLLFALAALCGLTAPLMADEMTREERDVLQQLESSNLAIFGNEIVGDDIIRRIMDIPEHAEMTEELALQAKRRLLAYYYDKGYTLARVWTAVANGRAFISIDEGKLEKIIVRGQGTAMTLAFKWAFTLPYDVYNRDLVHTKLRLFNERIGLGEVCILIVQSPEQRDVGFQLSDWGVEMFGRKRVYSYQLHVVMHTEKGSGPYIGAYSSPYYGLVPYVGYALQSPFFPGGDDSLDLTLETGYNVIEDLNKQSYVLRFTHVQAAGRYDFPSVAGFLRVFSESFVETSSFQRPDIPIDEYWGMVLHGSLNAAFDLTPEFSLVGGVAYEYKTIFSIKPVDSNPVYMHPFSNNRLGFSLGLEVVMNPTELRKDRLDSMIVDYTYQMLDITGGGAYHRLELDYKKLFPIGYNDFITRMRLLYTFGDAPFYDEQSVGGPLMRSFFDGNFYTERAGWISAEYRLSLWTDIIKISAYVDLAMFNWRARDTLKIEGEYYRDLKEYEEWKVLTSIGPGFHWLILDTLQFNLYATFGFADDTANIQYYFELTKVYF